MSIFKATAASRCIVCARIQISNPHVSHRFADVFNCLQPTELIIIITKMLMTGALSVVEPGSPVQLVLAALVMLTFTLITLKLAPYRHQSDDWITFLVSLVITGNTLAGFVLLMDKDNTPHNFNPKNIEALLLFMNITVLIVQVVNMILMKWGLWDKLLAQTWCQKLRLACGSVNSAETQKETDLAFTGSSKVVPSQLRASAVSAENDEVERLMISFSNSERLLEEQQARRRERSSINVQHRVAARRKIRQTKALTKAAVFAGIDEVATEKVLSVMKYERYPEGAVICEEGADADKFFIIVTGRCKVVVRGKGTSSMHVGDLKALDVMGENALVVVEDDADRGSRVRSATIIAVSDIVQTLELSRSEFERLVELGVIGEEVLQRMRAVQKDRREKREALIPSGKPHAHVGYGMVPPSPPLPAPGGTEPYIEK